MIIRYRHAAQKRPRGLYRGGFSDAWAYSGSVAAPVVPVVHIQRGSTFLLLGTGISLFLAAVRVLGAF